MYEVDFLAVGEESQSGDAIALRVGNLNGSREEQTVIVIDGGFKETGEQLVDFIKIRYGTDRIDYVVSTHPDQDHIGGLDIVLDECHVDRLLMHLPWLHGESVAKQITDDRATEKSINKNLRALSDAESLAEKAREKGIRIIEPFAGDRYLLGDYGRLDILGPSKDYYESLLLSFEGMPDYATEKSSIFKKAISGYRAIKELWNQDSIGNDGKTSATNNSSVILQITVDNHRLLFTGDAGIPALEFAAGRLENGADRGGILRLIQIPHHGSRHNVGSNVLNRIVGEIGGNPHTLLTAVVSCAKKEDGKHPNPRVLNAFRRRGALCYKTQEISVCIPSLDALTRPDYFAIEACPFYPDVEEDDD